MVEVGDLAPDRRVELIEGEIVDMPPIGTRHGAAVDRLARLLHRAVGDRAIVGCQRPIKLGDDSEPQPDLVLLEPREDFYAEEQPTESDVLLIIEVGETTWRQDRHAKMALYASHRIRELWILSPEGQLHVLRRPDGVAYQDVTLASGAGLLSIASLPDVALDLSGLIR